MGEGGGPGHPARPWHRLPRLISASTETSEEMAEEPAVAGKPVTEEEEFPGDGLWLQARRGHTAALGACPGFPREDRSAPATEGAAATPEGPRLSFHRGSKRRWNRGWRKMKFLRKKKEILSCEMGISAVKRRDRSAAFGKEGCDGVKSFLEAATRLCKEAGHVRKKDVFEQTGYWVHLFSAGFRTFEKRRYHPYPRRYHPYPRRLEPSTCCHHGFLASSAVHGHTRRNVCDKGHGCVCDPVAAFSLWLFTQCAVQNAGDCIWVLQG